MEEDILIIARQRGSDAGQCRRCKKNSVSVLSGIDKKTKEGSDHGSKVRTVHKEQDGEGKFL